MPPPGFEAAPRWLLCADLGAEKESGDLEAEKENRAVLSSEPKIQNGACLNVSRTKCIRQDLKLLSADLGAEKENRNNLLSPTCPPTPVPRRGFEPLTLWSEATHSIQLSYRGTGAGREPDALSS